MSKANQSSSGTRGVKISSNVLVIEDDDTTAAMIGNVLMLEGFGVRITNSRTAALLVLDFYLYDFIIMDLFMTGLEAEPFLVEVRRRTSRTKVVLISGLELDKLTQHAKRLGLSVFLSKPFSKNELVDALARF